MFNVIPNPPKFSKKIIFNLKSLLVSMSDLIWFCVITAILIPIIVSVKIVGLQIGLAVTYIFLEMIILWRWDGVWLRDLIWVMIKSAFIKRRYINKDAQLLTHIGKYTNGFIKKDNKYSKYYVINSTDISLLRDEEINNRVEALNNFFMFNENIEFTLFSFDKTINVDEDLDNIASQQDDGNRIYELLYFDKFQQMQSIELDNLSQKYYMLKITSTSRNNVDKAASIANDRLLRADITLTDATVEDIQNLYQKLYGKKINANRFNDDQSKNIYTKVQQIEFKSSYYKIYYKDSKADEKATKKLYRILSVRNTPKYADFQWLNTLFNIEGVTTINPLKMNSIKEAKQYINSTTRFLRLKYDNQNKSDLVEESQTLSYYEQMGETAQWISNGNSGLVNSKMFLIVQADKKKELDKQVGMVREICSSNKIKLDTLKFLQLDAFKEVAKD